MDLVQFSHSVGHRAITAVDRVAVGGPLDTSLAVTVHFHPDRLVGAQSLLDRLATDGSYRSQFETGTSNGGLTAFRGGDRWRWEHRMFDGAYDDAPAQDRPKYGALNYRRWPAGGAVRFGSAHFRLRPEILDRTTFCYPDSSTEPSHFGTAKQMSLITLAEQDHLDVLDDHIEAHIHGPLRLERDVEALVLDPSYHDTAISRAASSLPFALSWHHGFRLHVDVLADHADFRGPGIVAAGRLVAQNGWLTPKVIGEFARTDRLHPQILKRVWHCTARFGHTWVQPGR